MDGTVLSNWIDGKETAASSEAQRELLSPHDGRVVAQLPISDSDDLRCAVGSAKRAQAGWAELDLSERITYLRAFATAAEANADELAQLQRQEMGQPLGLGSHLVSQGAAALRAACDEALAYPFAVEVRGQAGTSLVERRPVGIAALITPWNSPVLSVLEQCGATLLSGNSVVVKPSEYCPMSVARLATLSGLPNGVLNVLLGDGSTGAELCSHPDIGLVIFTGSVHSGRAVALASAQRLARAILELGGKDAVIVDRGVDVEEVAAKIAFGSFLNTGQICTSMERIYVHADIAEQFIAALVEAAATWKFDDGSPSMPQLGPLVSSRQREIVISQIDDAKSKGARVVVGGTAPDGPGNFFPATVVVNVDESMLLFQEETFGPVAAVETVPSFEDALSKAGRGPYGLGATVYSNDPDNLALAGTLPVALLWLNEWQGRGEVMIYEPTGLSGLGATGGTASFDAATRPQTTFRAQT